MPFTFDVVGTTFLGSSIEFVAFGSAASVIAAAVGARTATLLRSIVIEARVGVGFTSYRVVERLRGIEGDGRGGRVARHDGPVNERLGVVEEGPVAFLRSSGRKWRGLTLRQGLLASMVKPQCRLLGRPCRGSER
jgi:hypothetical protein